MKLSKKQVKAFLEVISSDTTRPVLTTAKIDKHDDKTALVATDGYVLAELAAPELEEHIGKSVPRSELVKWYKLAGTKDTLTSAEIVDMLLDEPDNYPQWQPLIDNLSNQPMDQFSAKAQYLLTMETLADMPLTWQLNGKNAAMKAVANDCTYVVMPLRG